jgi:hypothetical protein
VPVLPFLTGCQFDTALRRIAVKFWRYTYSGATMTKPPFASAGSQRWLQVAVAHAPELLDQALRRSGAIAGDDSVEWKSPLEKDKFVEYRDGAVLRCLGLRDLPNRSLSDFWLLAPPGSSVGCPGMLEQGTAPSSRSKGAYPGSCVAA